MDCDPVIITLKGPSKGTLIGNRTKVTLQLTHIVRLNAFAISNYNFVSNQLNSKKVNKRMSSIKIFDWSSEGTLKYLKGVSGF